ncbi:MAG: ferritin family protein [Nanoarchaeota archaeon]
MVKLFRCVICGDSYIGDNAPTNCPFCGVLGENIKEYKDANVNYDVTLNEVDLENVKKALDVEISNTEFYFSASKKMENSEAKNLFKALGKIEAEHASIFKKILKLDSIEIKSIDVSNDYIEILNESNRREQRAINFYKDAAKVCENERVKEIFLALIYVEDDHLDLSKQRL